MNIHIIVEGDGEEKAGPALVRQLLWMRERFEFNVKVGVAHGRSNILKAGGLEQFIQRLRYNSECKGVIVLLDAEEAHCECPPDFARSLAQRARILNLPFSVVVVCARCEYECWFLVSLHTIKDRWLNPDAAFEGDPEEKYNAKEWLTQNMPKGRVYKETIDQVDMTFALDIPHTIQHSRSFRRMVHAIEELLNAIDNEVIIITPAPEANNQN